MTNYKYKKCDYYRADHIFEEVGRTYYEWVDTTYIDLKCKCGKRDLKMVDGYAYKKVDKV